MAVEAPVPKGIGLQKCAKEVGKAPPFDRRRARNPPFPYTFHLVPPVRLSRCACTRWVGERALTTLPRTAA
jgi:hypothetical protein